MAARLFLYRHHARIAKCVLLIEAWEDLNVRVGIRVRPPELPDLRVDMGFGQQMSDLAGPAIEQTRKLVSFFGVFQLIRQKL